MINRLTCLVIAACLAVAPAFAQSADSEAEAFIDALVIELRTNAERDGEGSTSVRATLEQNLATGAIGRFLIRGEIDKAATEAQRLRYEELFPLYIAAAYAEEIGQLASREIRISGSLERKPGDLIVRSALFDAKGAKRANIDWRVRLTGDGEYKLFDVLVERISPLITRRQSFSQMFADDGLDGLLAHMQETIDAGITIETDDE